MRRRRELFELYPLHGRLHRLHQGRPAPGRVPAHLPRPGHRRRSPHLRRRRRRLAPPATSATNSSPASPPTRHGTSSSSPPPRTRATRARSDRCSACSTPDSLTCPTTSPAPPTNRYAAGSPTTWSSAAEPTSPATSEDTPFPSREDAEATYTLSREYRDLFDQALAYARETVTDASGGAHRQRVRWWSALALLRSLASSPAAAAATLRARADTAATPTVAEADELGRRSIFDTGDDETTDEGVDVTPGADPTASDDGTAGGDTADPEAARTRRRLLAMARIADGLAGAKDHKLTKAIHLIDGLVGEGFNPIVFCRFIPTAEYVADALRSHFGNRADVMAVTGRLAPAEREARVDELVEAPKRILVATDCLSEGVNLQHHFDAVLHYDLAWSPYPPRAARRQMRPVRSGVRSRPGRHLLRH